MADPKDEYPLSGKIAAFIVTLIAIPFLFVATCFPVGLFAMGMGSPTVTIIFTVYGVLLVGFGIYKAVRTDNPGTRWAIIVAMIAGIAALLYFFYPSYNFAWWR
jgi:hypothetical protein